MLPMVVRSHIDVTLSAPGARAAFCDRMLAFAERQGAELDEVDLDNLAELAERYVRMTVRFLESCATAASQARAERLLAPLIGAASRVYVDPVKTGAREGLFELVCDSYVVRHMFAVASERTRAFRGFPLFSTDPHPEEETVRAMIGAPIADVLEDAAEQALETPEIRLAMRNAFALPGSLRASAHVDDWEPGWEEEVARFGRSVGLRFAA